MSAKPIPWMASSIARVSQEIQDQIENSWEITWISVANNGFIYVQAKNDKDEREYVFSPDKKMLYVRDKGTE